MNAKFLSQNSFRDVQTVGGRGYGGLMGHSGGDFEETGSHPAGASSHAVFQALALVEQAAQALDGVATWSLSDGELRDAVADLFQRLQGVEAGWLGLVRDLDARPDAVTGARPGEVAKTFLIHRLRQTPAQAGRDVRVAHALDPPAPCCRNWGRRSPPVKCPAPTSTPRSPPARDVPKRMLAQVDETTGRSGADRGR